MISNSTPIICLSKLNRIELLNNVYGKVIVPPAVRREVLVRGKPGYHQIQDAMRKGWLLVERPKSEKNFGLHSGENQAISLALEKGQALLVDDYAANVLANSLGIRTERTTTVLFRALSKGIITKEETLSLLNRLVEDGYYITPGALSKLITRIVRYRQQ